MHLGRSVRRRGVSRSPSRSRVGVGIRHWRLDQFIQIGFAAAFQYSAPNQVPQPQYGGEVLAERLHRLTDLHADRGLSRHPLIAAQHRSRAAKGARNDRETGLARDFEPAKKEAQQSRSVGKRSFGKNHKHAIAACGIYRLCDVGEALGQIVTFDEQNAEAAQHHSHENLIGKFLFGQVSGLSGKNRGENKRIDIA